MFTRQEVLALSGLSSGKLSYLDRLSIVTPVKTGSKGRPICLYTWEQLIELRIIHHLRQDASLQQLRQAKEYLKDIGDTESLASKTIIALNNKIYLISSNKLGEIDRLVYEISGKKQGQILIHSVLQISELVREIWDEAKKAKIVNFADRAKDKAA